MAFPRYGPHSQTGSSGEQSLMTRFNKRKMTPSPRRKISLFMRLLPVIIAISILWSFWTEPDEESTPEPPRMVAYGEQSSRNDWPPVTNSGSSFTASRDLLKVNYYVILDGSGSMKESECSTGRNKMADAVDALSIFVNSVPQDANIGVSVFNNNKIVELLPLQREGNVNAAKLSQIVPGGATPLRSAIDNAYGKMVSQGKRQLGYGEYHLVVITDGLATEGEDPTAVVRQMLSDSPVNLYTIGFCIGADHSLNQPGFSTYRAADNLEALKQGLSEVLAEAPSFTLDSFQEPVKK